MATRPDPSGRSTDLGTLNRATLARPVRNVPVRHPAEEQLAGHQFRPEKLGQHRQVSSSSHVSVEEEGSDESSRSHSAPHLDSLLAAWNLELQLRIDGRQVGTVVLVYLAVKSKL